jgi:hypothetical protein
MTWSEIPWRARSGGEVPAHHHVGAAEPPGQVAGDEPLRPRRGVGEVEGLHHHRVQPGGLEQLELPRERGDDARRELRPQHPHRVRLEGEDAGAPRPRGAPGAGGLDQPLVAEVHPVEVADGDRAAAEQPGRPRLLDRVEHLHRRVHRAALARRQSAVALARACRLGRAGALTGNVG